MKGWKAFSYKELYAELTAAAAAAAMQPPDGEDRRIPPTQPPAGLHELAQRGELEDLRAWIQAAEDRGDGGELIDRADGDGMTALQLACIHAPPKLVMALLHAGASVEAASRDGARPLHCAAYAGNLQTVHLLLSHGADAAGTNSLSGGTALHAAVHGTTGCRSGDPLRFSDVARLLLSKGCPADAKDRMGHTAKRLALVQKKRVSTYSLKNGLAAVAAAMESCAGSAGSSAPPGSGKSRAGGQTRPNLPRNLLTGRTGNCSPVAPLALLRAGKRPRVQPDTSRTPVSAGALQAHSGRRLPGGSFRSLGATLPSAAPWATGLPPANGNGSAGSGFAGLVPTSPKMKTRLEMGGSLAKDEAAEARLLPWEAAAAAGAAAALGARQHRRQGSSSSGGGTSVVSAGYRRQGIAGQTPTPKAMKGPAAAAASHSSELNGRRPQAVAATGGATDKAQGPPGAAGLGIGDGLSAIRTSSANGSASADLAGMIGMIGSPGSGGGEPDLDDMFLSYSSLFHDPPPPTAAEPVSACPPYPLPALRPRVCLCPFLSSWGRQRSN